MELSENDGKCGSSCFIRFEMCYVIDRLDMLVRGCTRTCGPYPFWVAIGHKTTTISTARDSCAKLKDQRRPAANGANGDGESFTEQGRGSGN